jgi:hypothetical protein
MEKLPQIIDNIRFIHENYLSDIVKSTIIEHRLKALIEECKRTFDPTFNNAILEKNKKLIIDNYIKENGLNPEESSAKEVILKTLNLTAIILTCYNLSFYEFIDTVKVRGSTGDASHVELKAVEVVDVNVQNFLNHYITIYEIINYYRNRQGYDNLRICLELKKMYNGLICDDKLKCFLDQTKHILGSLFNRSHTGGNKLRNKYLKYKKKYIELKKQSIIIG